MLVACIRMAGHLLTFNISFGGKGNISVTSKDFRAVTSYPILFDKEVSRFRDNVI
jgi:hypothetical protein